jgi:hypothetical protein
MMKVTIYGNDEFYCIHCYTDFAEDLRDLKTYRPKNKVDFIPVLNDATFQCPERDCDSKLSFSEFIDGRCCKAAKKGYILKNGINYGIDDTIDRTRNVKQELEKMMNLLQYSQKEEDEAKAMISKKEMDYQKALADLNIWTPSKGQIRSNFESSLAEFNDKNKGFSIIFSLILFR